MSQKEENNGLLSKVVKFVKNPTTNWADLDQQEPDRESSYSKQMLKEMIERKRRNDFVRKREFDMLRKMRRSEVMAGQDPAARPSFFQSSMPSKPDDRAMTLKKIDEIEAQMSMQWWKTKHGDSAQRPGGAALVPLPSQPPEVSRPNGAHPAPASAPLPKPVADKIDPQRLAPGLTPPGQASPPVVATAPVKQAAPAQVKPKAPAAVAPGTSRPSGTDSNLGFSISKGMAIDVGEFAHDPELEEAAIRFANGDDAGAEAGLLEVLGPRGNRVDHAETWLTLFDLYRATGAHDRFEIAAIDYAGRFGRSAPTWLSLPDAVGKLHAGADPTPAVGKAVADWTCPSVVGTQTLAALNAALAKAPQPWRLSWVKLTTVDESALEGFTRLLTQWATQPVQLRFIGADNLDKVLSNGTPSGDKDINPAWWKLRMEMLRVTHRPDDFELVALDYCVTYEVSPPSWEGARSQYKPLQADGSYVPGHTIIGEACHDSIASIMPTDFSDAPATTTSMQTSNLATVELAGRIEGNATEALDQLEGKLQGADVMVINCGKLIRIDFSAAGTLLNWVTARQAEGSQVQFAEVHRLVAAFFNVIGISEHSKVVVRTD